ncbi:MAG: signal peptidase II [Treponema sp.]|nr:signal peptidase II [Treponema sp.]
MTANTKTWVMPFSLTALIIILDQVTKAIVVANWPRPGTLIKDVFNNGFLLLYHVRNKAIAFSLGDGIPQPFRFALFVIIPVVVLVFLIWYYFNTTEFNRLQRWAIAGIIGGGFGNIIDRIVRKDGVVDFVSVKFYGLFGLARWPTFNVADASVVICCIILLVTMIYPGQVHSKTKGRFQDE